MSAITESLKSLTTSNSQLPPHVIVVARAGTGKTTTLVEGLRGVRGGSSHLTPSPQQAAVWEALKQSAGVRSVAFVAFNKSIATELQERVPEGCVAMTMHSMGLKAVTAAFGRVKINNFRVQDIISELLNRDIYELRRDNAELISATEKLVGLCKMNLVGFHESCATRGQDGGPMDWDEELAALAAEHDIDLNGNASRVLELVPQILDRCRDVKRDGCIDFNDMIWLPVIHNLAVTKYDLLLVDEAQDLNRCQQELALKVGRRLILCGDPKQAVYAFAGADSQSINRMKATLEDTPQGVVMLPLTVTRRCGKAIVAEAQKIVPDFKAHDTNPAGAVDTTTEQECHDAVKDGDMILCRVNAPLVSQCFKFLKMNRKANIQGRDIGQGLLSTIKKSKATNVVDLMDWLDNWLQTETAKENRKKNPSDTRLIGLRDRYGCLMCFCEEATTIEEVTAKITSIFDDDSKSGIRLSSIHKAKGLEADTVYLLQLKGASVPHPMARTNSAREQELNLKYVAITRAIQRFVYVTD